ncbi:MAG: methyltransferase [Rhizobiales bacterium 62-17]|mgnify:FL=1|nr:methyltransferase domain-containing protein [Hyphomicrobiales bacterium]OJY04064.1 MAG: methyltransferase [Rhizobiales bacterium 62-17]
MSGAAEHMDRIYRWQAPIYDLTRKPYLLGRDRLIAALDPPPGGTVLEIGCGTGRNLIAAARRWPRARFYGFDISSVMLANARRAVRDAGLDKRIMLAPADAALFDPQQVFGRGSFDRVFMSYTLSMIPPWREALARGCDVLSPDGELFVADFGDQAHLPKAFRAMLYRWLAAFSVTPRLDLEEELGRQAEARGRVSKFERPYRGYAFLGHIGPGV